ncbi:MAG TPA: LysM peptidoglycan-binding domain-containing protein [Candidatus Hydrogenedentes bacterium]|nr:LysM peptidoglycan-binding domain-containing protein [Candidatus Hydrogenedentota bacterium]
MWVLAFGIVVVTSGCQTTSHEVHQFEPVPMGRVGAEDLEPVEPPDAVDLLEAANEAFEAANAAQESGDAEAALRNYTMMLELLIQADLDPEIFYNLRGDLARLLTATSREAERIVRSRPVPIGGRPFEPGEMGELKIEFPLSERVLAEIEEIRNSYPKNFGYGLNRSGKYLPHIETELAKAGLPRELAWLAMVESQFTPKIVSPAGAGGMWQFMRSTGKMYNLRMDYYVDERFHWQKSTEAAIAYLTDLYRMFESWPLAISAYNMGEHGMARAIAANGGEKDLWRLIETPPAAYQLRLETKKFYAKFLASVLVGQAPDHYGFSVTPDPLEPHVAVPTKGSYSLGALEKECGLPSGALARLNPHLVRGVTPADAYEVLVPVEAQDKVVAALSKVPQVSQVSASVASAGGIHVVRAGETLSQIAQRYHVSCTELMRLNHIRSANRISAGKKLTLPGDATGVSVGATSTAEPATEEDGERRVHKVKSGDSLFDIGKAFRVSVSDLQAWNGLGKTSAIRIGQLLYVSPPAPASAGIPDVIENGTKLVHVVRAGEYPAVIARRYGVKLEDLLRWNNLSKTSTIMVGDKLDIYKDGNGTSGKDSSAAPASESKSAESAPAATRKTVHKIAPGDTSSRIAAKYGVSTGDILKWNNWSAKSILRVGRDCIVYLPGDEASAKPEAQTPAPEPAAEAEKAPEASPAEQTPEKVEHVVSKGENPTLIAQKYGVSLKDLFEWNGWKKNPVLRVGDKVTVCKP